MNPLLLVDSYKIHHYPMYPENTVQIYSNLTPRKSRIKDIDKVVVFGIQHFVLEYLIKQFNDNFFCWKLNESSHEYNTLYGWENNSKEREVKAEYHRYSWNKSEIISKYKRHCPVDTKHIEALWDLGFLPIKIKALPEGSRCPIGVPLLTIQISDPVKYGEHFWIVNYLETLMSCMLWQPITSATIAFEYKKLLTKYAKETDEKNLEFVNWQAHDFSMRGLSSPESAILSGMGHLLSFTGTDTIPAIYQVEESYGASGLIGASVPATEHSVACLSTFAKEYTQVEEEFDEETQAWKLVRYF